MTKKEKVQAKLNKLLEECVKEQKAIGLHPTNNIEIYIGRDPNSGSRCSKYSDGCSFVLENLNKAIILINRKCYDAYSNSNILLKCLIHHELIHLNLKEDGRMIKHNDDWELFTELANRINTAYDIDPLSSYDVSCWNNDKCSPTYNTVAECNKCGAKSFMFLDENKNYKLNKSCPFCGGKLTYKKARNYN